MKLRSLIIICMFIILIPGNASGECTKYYHDLFPQGDYKGNLEFRYLDMDSSQTGVQDSITINPGGKVTPVISWNWGENVCKNCNVYVNALGDWDEKQELTKLFSGLPGEKSNIVNYFSFLAPEIPGEYEVRVILSFKDGFSQDFRGESLCQSQCATDDECHIFIARGNIVVKEVSSTDEIPPGIELVLPGKGKVFGDIEFFVGTAVPLDVTVVDGQAALKLLIDGEEVSDYFPYTWDTFNLTPGKHVILAEAKDHKGNIAQDSISVILKNTTREEIISQWAAHLQGDIQSIDQSQDGQIAVAHGNSMSLYNQKGLDWTFKAPGDINKVALSNDGHVVAGLTGNDIFVFSGNGTPLWNHTAMAPISKMALSGDGDFVAYSINEVLFVLDEMGALEGNNTFLNQVSNLEISNDGTIILVSLSSEQGNLKSMTRNREILKSLTVPGNIDSIAMSNRNDLFGVAAGNKFYLLQNRISQWETKENPVNYSGLAISSNGKYILLYDNHNITILNGQGELVRRATLENAGQISISPSGSNFVYSKGPYFFVVKISPSDPFGKLAENYRLILGIFSAIVAVLLFFVFVKRIKSRKKEEKPIGEMEIGIKPEPSKKIPIMEPKYLATLKIKAINSINGQPIKGARVESESGAVTTDSSGIAVITGITGDFLDIKVKCQGYEQKIKSIPMTPENAMETIELLPLVREDNDLNLAMENSLEVLENSFLQLKQHDQCLPSYIKGIGMAIKESLNYGYIYLPSDRGEEYKKAFFHHMTHLFNRTALGLEDIMTDWKNVALYKAASSLESRSCVPEKIHDEGSIVKMGIDPGGYYSIEYSNTMNRLKNIDQLITSRIGDYTVNISMGLWKLARDLLYGIENVEPERAATTLIIVNLVLGYIEKMLADPHIQERLKLSIL